MAARGEQRPDDAAAGTRPASLTAEMTEQEKPLGLQHYLPQERAEESLVHQHLRQGRDGGPAR